MFDGHDDFFCLKYDIINGMWGEKMSSIYIFFNLYFKKNIKRNIAWTKNEKKSTQGNGIYVVAFFC